MELLLGLVGGYVLARTCHEKLAEVTKNAKEKLKKLLG